MGLELVPLPQSKMLSHCDHPSSAAAPSCLSPAGHEGSTGGKGRAWPHVMLSLSTSQMFVSSLEKLLLGRWEGDTCVVTSMSLVFLDVTPGVSLVCGSRDGPAAAPGLIPKASPAHVPPALRFGASPNSSPQVFLSALTLPPREGEGRSSLFPAEPTARAFTSTTDHSKTRIKKSFPMVFFPPFPVPFCFNIRCPKCST